MLRSITAAVLIVMLFVWPCNAYFFTYSQWESLAEGNQIAYVGGIFDSLVSIATPGQMYQEHYTKCLAREDMTLGQLSRNMKVYASSRPKLQAQGVSGALINYLIELCGKPPQ